MDHRQRIRDALHKTMSELTEGRDALDALEDLATLEGFVDDFAQARVDDARAAGASWSQIADRLGVTRQAAHKRFGVKQSGKRSLELRLVFEKKPE